MAVSFSLPRGDRKKQAKTAHGGKELALSKQQGEERIEEGLAFPVGSSLKPSPSAHLGQI